MGAHMHIIGVDEIGCSNNWLFYGLWGNYFWVCRTRFRRLVAVFFGSENGTHGWVDTEDLVAWCQNMRNKEVKKLANKQKIRIRLRAYDHELIDSSAQQIVESAKRTGAEVSGPIPLPTEKEIITILRAVHKYKDSREQFEQRTHKRLIDILNPNQKTLESLKKLNLPSGVDIEIKL